MRNIYNWQTDGWTDDDNTIEPFYKGSKKCAIGRVGEELTANYVHLMDHAFEEKVFLVTW